jgi:tRNA(Ile)-lysidine synthase
MVHESEIYARWSLEMKRSGLFQAGERVGVAVSGGPDSMLLLEFMKRFAERRGLALAVVHFNHQLRGAESDADERFVEERARQAGIPFMVGGTDVAQAARERRRNLEATGRELRYRLFFSLVVQGRLDKVATAHTSDDQAETVLLRFLRGTGTRGLGGIYPVLEGGLVRPFLNLTRQEVLSEVERWKLEYRIDTTNLDSRLVRNKVRLELLPWLAKEFNPAVVKLLKEFADRAREDENYLEQQAGERAKMWRSRSDEGERIPASALAGFHPALERRILRQMIQGVRGSLKGITHAHVEALRHWAREGQSGKQLFLPDLIAWKEFNWLALGRPPAPERAEFAYPVRVPGIVSVPQLGVCFRLKIVTAEGLRPMYNNPRERSSTLPSGLDPQKLPAGLILRSWRAGDRFQPWGSQKPSKLKELLRQHRIGVRERALWPVLESGAEIVWVRGFPPGRSAAAPLGAESTVVITEEPYGNPGGL